MDTLARLQRGFLSAYKIIGQLHIQYKTFIVLDSEVAVCMNKFRKDWLH